MAGIIVPRENSHLLQLELRHVEASILTNLSMIIDGAKAWEHLLKELTRYHPANNEIPHLNLSQDTINLIKREVNCGRSPSLALLSYWSITGRRRPTVKTLLSYLNLCHLTRAEEYVRQSILGLDSTYNSSPGELLPADIINRRSSYQINPIFKFDNLQEMIGSLDTKIIKYEFESLYEGTNGFSNIPYQPLAKTGFKIGEGEFSSVYRAAIKPRKPDQPNGYVAVKLLKSACNMSYLVNEIKLMMRVKHENILELLGIAWRKLSSDQIDGYICLVYPYMQNGSLYDCLALGLATRNMEHLRCHERLNIAKKLAEGISYFHKFPEGPVIHRDIKTKNIFIDVNLEPKLGDFTLVRLLDPDCTTQVSQNAMGTSLYMPPEAFRGAISTKFDTFSYGVVLLELLTGLKPLNSEENEDWLTRIGEKMDDITDRYAEDVMINEAIDKFLIEILDAKAGEWNLRTARILFRISQSATEVRKQRRPEISEIITQLEAAQVQ